jgi:hypothetical protein
MPTLYFIGKRKDRIATSAPVVAASAYECLAICRQQESPAAVIRIYPVRTGIYRSAEKSSSRLLISATAWRRREP